MSLAILDSIMDRMVLASILVVIVTLLTMTKFGLTNGEHQHSQVVSTPALDNIAPMTVTEGRRDTFDGSDTISATQTHDRYFGQVNSEAGAVPCRTFQDCAEHELEPYESCVSTVHECSNYDFSI